MKKHTCTAFVILLLLCSAVLFSCGADETPEQNNETAEKTMASTETEGESVTVKTEKPLDEQLPLDNLKSLTFDVTQTHQTIESFGASGAWWAQYIGVCDDERTDGSTVRDYITRLLFDKDDGIGLNSYRYCIGAGSREINDSGISDNWRRAFSFETEPGVYDWSRDEGAVWVMNRAAELGVDEINLFINSPLCRLTVSGMAHSTDRQKDKSNLPPENYEAFADYTLDVAEHFKSLGLPVASLSPINEPQWDWNGGQEGCHYDTDETVDVLKLFVERIGERDTLDGVVISAPEGGEWQKATTEICRAILDDETLGSYFGVIDNHSYWSDAGVKKNFKSFMDKKYPDITLKCSEWCEMVNGRDKTMDSAINLAKQIYEDMTILDCVSWQYWIAVSCYDYRDGLIYVDKNTYGVSIPKRLWSMGNYSRFIDRGYVRVGCETDASGLSASAYSGVNENGMRELVAVVINPRGKAVNMSFAGADTSLYSRVSVNVTDETHDLEEVYYAELTSSTAVVIPATSVTTVVLSGQK